MKRKLWSGLIVLCLLALIGLQPAAADIVVQDNFSDGNYTSNPTWTPEAGTFSVVNEELKFGMIGAVAISLPIGDVQDNTPASISFDLYAANLYATFFEFQVEVIDSNTGTSQKMIGVAWPSVWGSLSGGGSSGFAAYGASGEFGGGVVGASLENGWQTMTIDFDPTTGVVVKRDDVIVSQWTNFNGLSKVDTLIFGTNTNDNTRDWTIDNVYVTAVPEPLTASLLLCGGAILACRKRAKARKG